MSAGAIILILKAAVTAVTLLLAASIWAVWRGKYRLHGRINMVVFVLTLTALLGLEVVARILYQDEFDEFFRDPYAEKALTIHLCFSLPAAVLLPFMLYTGLKHHRRVHLTLAAIFAIFWTGTFITGVFFLPHSNVP